MSATEVRAESPVAAAPALNVRNAMRRIRIAWMFGSAWMHVTTGVALNLYADQVMRMPLFWLGVLFLISSGLHVLAIPWLFLLHEPASRTPSEAVRYVFLSIREQLLTTFSIPLRVFRRLGGREGNGENGRAKKRMPLALDLCARSRG